MYKIFEFDWVLKHTIADTPIQSNTQEGQRSSTSPSGMSSRSPSKSNQGAGPATLRPLAQAPNRQATNHPRSPTVPQSVCVQMCAFESEFVCVHVYTRTGTCVASLFRLFTLIFDRHSIPRPATPYPLVSSSTSQPSVSLSSSQLSLLSTLFGFLRAIYLSTMLWCLIYNLNLYNRK
jgi:hypothetical protein